MLCSTILLSVSLLILNQIKDGTKTLRERDTTEEVRGIQGDIINVIQALIKNEQDSRGILARSPKISDRNGVVLYNVNLYHTIVRNSCMGPTTHTKDAAINRAWIHCPFPNRFDIKG